MAMLKSAFITAEEGLTNPAASHSHYYIKELNGMFHLLRVRHLP